MTMTSRGKEPDIQTLPFHTDEGIGTIARLGMIILQSDQTIEHEAAALIHDKNFSPEISNFEFHNNSIRRKMTSLFSKFQIAQMVKALVW